MSFQLSENEIKQRLVRLQNLEHLHKQARKKIVRQDKETKLLKQQILLLKEQNKEQSKIIEYLKLQLEEIKIKVFGKKKKDKDKNNDGGLPQARKPADRTSASYQRPVPNDSEVTETKSHPIDNCSECGTALTKKRIIVFLVEDVPLDKQSKEVVKHKVEQGYCEKCKKWQSAVPLPSAKCVLGQKLKKYICYLSIILRLSHQQIENHVRDIHQIKVSMGEIAKILEKESVKLRPEFERLKQRIQEQPAHHYDETSWKVAKNIQGNFGWIMTGTETNEAVFLLGQSRGNGNVEKLNPKPNIGITDDYGAYKNKFKHHQLCWSHLFRKFRDMAESEVLEGKQKETCLKNYRMVSDIYGKLKQTLSSVFDYEKEHLYLLEQLTNLSKPNAGDLPKLKTIKETLFKNREKYLTCLKFPGIVPPDNNKAERGLRHLVIKRKISYGSKTEKGAETTSILASVLLSLKWMNPDNFMKKLLTLGG